MKRVWIGAAIVCLLGACQSRSAPPRSIDDPIVGEWRGSRPGGPATATATWAFRADGTYRMTGFPSIGEAGRWRIVRVEDGDYRLSLTERRTCDPCLQEAPNEDGPRTVEPALLDDDRLTFRNQSLRRVR